MIGIYKITSPSGKVYIGQSKDILKRFKTYSGCHCKKQPKLYNSFKKYGVDKHLFDVLEICDIDKLNEKERLYQELYECINYGLNCILTETKYKPRKCCKKRHELNKLASKRFFEENYTNELMLNIYTQTEYAKLIKKSVPYVNKLIKTNKVDLYIVNGANLIKAKKII